jgi:hypothetical protein
MLIRCWAAYWLVDLLDGRIDDVNLVNMLQLRFEAPWPCAPCEYAVEGIQKVLGKIAKNGKTWYVRARARLAKLLVRRYSKDI